MSVLFGIWGDSSEVMFGRILYFEIFLPGLILVMHNTNLGWRRQKNIDLLMVVSSFPYTLWNR